MVDLPSIAADRCCPACGAVQPLYVTRRAGQAGLQRGPADVVACPGCGAALRLTADPRDPGGVRAALGMVVGLTGVIVGVVWAVRAFDLGQAALGGLLVVVVFGGIGLSVMWNVRAARRRMVVVVREDET